MPCVVDLAAMRDALTKMGADPKKANPLIPVDLVIDHSVQVDEFGTSGAFAANALRIGDTVIHAREFRQTRVRLEKAGILVRHVDASELAKAEGGVTCCSLIVK